MQLETIFSTFLALAATGTAAPTENPLAITLISGNNPMAEYFTSGGKNYELKFKTSLGRTYIIHDWDTMTAETCRGLADTKSSSAKVPFIDANFANNLNKAWMQYFGMLVLL
ncbi:hypothetical protein FSARC_6509 [Fusarium sarcochroum]|uniref:Uncharacterized protein n=1 Tax=Fusarium sarcochroum TaxID=1208366 RepID=A0A8H4TXB3_9HYPO|nr:hypothetical protein FSARC_6509 [Fusarium sarcochroum]